VVGALTSELFTTSQCFCSNIYILEYNYFKMQES